MKLSFCSDAAPAASCLCSSAFVAMPRQRRLVCVASKLSFGVCVGRDATPVVLQCGVREKLVRLARSYYKNHETTPSKFLASDCDEILSEDLSAGQIYKGISVVNLFEFWL